jgi:dienelactone hydrolase
MSHRPAEPSFSRFFPLRSIVAGAAALFAGALFALALPACGGPPSAVDAPTAAAPSAVAPSVATASSSVSASSGVVTTASLRRLFAYDRAEPLDLRVAGGRTVGGATLRDVSFLGHGARVTGVLCVPAGTGPFAAVLYAPGVGCAAGMFETDMAALERAGIASLAVDPPDGRRPYAEPVSLDSAAVAAAHVQYVRDLRRGLDLLVSLPEVDPARLGYVGYSWGGYVGGLLAGVRAPVGAYVLTYAGADWVSADPAATAGFPDPAAAIAVARRAAFLFQAGVDDPLFSRAGVRRYYDAAPGRRDLQWFPGGHGDLWGSSSGDAVESHREWLEKNL